MVISKLSRSQKALLVLFLIVVFLYCFNALNQSDNFYHIKAGQIMWQTKSVPHTDIFSENAQGAPWITHEWLSEIMFYGVYHATGFWGLIVLVALLAAATYYVLIKIALDRGANFYATLLLAFLLGYLTFQLWTPRPQAFVYLCFAVLLYLLERYRREERRWLLVASVLLVWLWANLNASFLLGVGVLFVYAGVAWLPLFFQRYFSQTRVGQFFTQGNTPSLRTAKILTLVVVGTTVLCFVNPNTYKIFTYIFAIQQVSKALAVYEWQPIFAFIYEFNMQFMIALLSFFGILLVWWYGVRRQSRELQWLVLVLVTFILPFVAIRYLGFWAVVAIPAVAVVVSVAAAPFFGRFSEKKFGIFLLIFLSLVLVARLFSLPHSSVAQDLLPVNAVNFIQANHINGPVFNLYNEGGYLIYRLYPQQKVFMDGRSEVYAGQPLAEFFQVVGVGPQWNYLVNDKYKFNYFLLAYTPPSLANSVYPLVVNLMNNNWVLVYWDDTSLIFLRNTPANASLIARYGLRYVSPFRQPEDIPLSQGKPALLELQSLLSRSSQVENVQIYTQDLLQDLNIKAATATSTASSSSSAPTSTAGGAAK